MEKLKKNKGITMVALVVTIVVLLILAGISIGTLTGENRTNKKCKWSKREDRNSKWNGSNRTSNNTSNEKKQIWKIR